MLLWHQTGVENFHHASTGASDNGVRFVHNLDHMLILLVRVHDTLAAFIQLLVSITTLRLAEQYSVLHPCAACLQAEFNPELWTEGELGQQLQACSLVIGLHPDQATDSIVDFAMQFGKPFAVVPCCVFPRCAACTQLCCLSSLSVS